MFQNLHIPFKEISTETTLDIIKEASGKPKHEIKKFCKELKTPEAKQINSREGNTYLSKSQLKKLFQDAHDKGFFFNKRRLLIKLRTVGEEEKFRHIKYSQGRTKVAKRLKMLKSGDTEFSVREIDKLTDNRSESTIGKRTERVGKIHEIALEQKSKILGDIDKKKDNKKDVGHELPDKGKVIDLLID